MHNDDFSTFLQYFSMSFQFISRQIQPSSFLISYPSSRNNKARRCKSPPGCSDIILLFYILQYLHKPVVLNSAVTRMQTKKEICAKLSNKDKYSVRINQNGIFQYKEGDIKHSRKICNYNKSLFVKIVKTEIMGNNKYKFVVRITEDANVIEVFIDGKDDLERLYRIVGVHSIMLGLQEVIASFKKIGEGSFAQVYEAITNYQCKFALKCFEKKGFESNEKTKKAYLNEIEIMKKLNSPYLVSFDYLFQTDKAFYLKMEYFEKTLKDKITSKMLVKNQKRFMRQLLIGLQEMRSKGVVHRDLKPDNIMIRKNAKGEEQCVIIDFGLATFVQAVPYLYFRCGTPGFLSPEIANLTNKKEKQQCISDVFSLGCIFYKMLTGHYLFGGKTAKDVLHHNRKCEYNSSFDGLSIKEKSLLLEMIDTNPNTRITPQKALKHPYFQQDVDDCDEIPDEECALEKKIKRIVNGKVKNMETVYSSMESINEHSASSRAYNISKRKGLKDSCLTFDLGNDKSSLNQEQFAKKSIANSRSCRVQRKQSRFSKLSVL